jgi:hypothetical protein
MDQRSPAEEDSIVHGFFFSLQRFSPRPGFADGIMSEVRVPAPRWVQAAANAKRSLVETGRVWWLLGGFAGTSIASVSAVLAIAFVHTASMGALVDAMIVTVAIPIWRTVLGGISAITQAAYRAAEITVLPAESVLPWTAAVLALISLSGWMLYRLMQPTWALERDGHASP